VGATDILETDSSLHRKQTSVSASLEEVERAMESAADILNQGIYWKERDGSDSDALEDASKRASLKNIVSGP